MRLYTSDLFCMLEFEVVFIWGKGSKSLLWYQSAVKTWDQRRDPIKNQTVLRHSHYKAMETLLRQRGPGYTQPLLNRGEDGAVILARNHPNR